MRAAPPMAAMAAYSVICSITPTHGRTILLITHDLDGLDQVDEIVVLHHGRVVQRGTHQEILAQAGLYRTPCSAGR